MQTYRLQIQPQTAFSTPLLGETLFGQVCWAISLLKGEEHLQDLLNGYCEGSPFAVFSDAFPAEYLPFPTAPSYLWKESSADRKLLKSIRWLPLSVLSYPFEEWQEKALEVKTAAPENENGSEVKSWQEQRLQAHNSINRLTMTTGTDEFAPYLSNVTYFKPGSEMDLYVGIDEDRVERQLVEEALKFIGLSGYGKDATTGLGKFEIRSMEPIPLLQGGRTVLTLSSASLCGLILTDNSFYKTKTHFGRHGAFLASSENPFKKPLLLAERGAVLSFSEETGQPFIGSGISDVSWVQKSAVHQGYALTIPLQLPCTVQGE